MFYEYWTFFYRKENGRFLIRGARADTCFRKEANGCKGWMGGRLDDR